MKTENTPADKLKFIANYWGQLALCYKGYNQPTPVDLLNIVREGDFLSLRSISSLTDEELLFIAKIFDLSSDQIADTDLQEWVEALFSEMAGYYIDGYTGTQMQHLIDYLRSIGILIPWMDLSVEEIKAYGWAKELEITRQ